MKFTFRYSPLFLKVSDELFTHEEQVKLEMEIMANPEKGDVIPGGKGLRKMRFGAKGKGKRGGSRIIYIIRLDEDRIGMVYVYAKNKQADLSRAELERLIQEAESL